MKDLVSIELFNKNKENIPNLPKNYLIKNWKMTKLNFILRIDNNFYRISNKILYLIMHIQCIFIKAIKFLQRHIAVCSGASGTKTSNWQWMKISPDKCIYFIAWSYEKHQILFNAYSFAVHRIHKFSIKSLDGCGQRQCSTEV